VRSTAVAPPSSPYLRPSDLTLFVLRHNPKAKFDLKRYVMIAVLEKGTGSASASRCSASRTAWRPVKILQVGTCYPRTYADLHCLARDNADSKHTGTAWFRQQAGAHRAYPGSRSVYCPCLSVVVPNRLSMYVTTLKNYHVECALLSRCESIMTRALLGNQEA
jgi:hypothetical protein